MKARFPLLFMLFCSINVFQAQQNPQPFIPNIVKQFPNVRDIAISPDGNEVLFSAQSIMGNLSAIVEVKRKNNAWSLPKITTFSGQYFDLEPFFSKDGLTLYFVSTRPKPNSKKGKKDFDIWYVTRPSLNDEWSSPVNMGTPINTEHGEFYPSVADNGNFYFTRDNPELKRKDDIYVSKKLDGTYSEAIALSDSINTTSYEYNAFVAPDESYIIFGGYNREDGYGSGDLYISYHTKSGWSEAKNLGKNINSDKMDYCPFVDTKHKTLYFTSKRDATNVEFDSPLTTEAFLSELYKYDNGLSRLYKIGFKSQP
ncbi:TolB-like translocation protein [Hyunsoonleella ulvae]|uniref:PD40 domain-containing protein n=1 Tax=Hyunsoonleella ulvae TaxID=2799948 RepID=UPI0019395E91|nr:PD40 domain-containing protein [Hyunsoonleella ulvae]